MSSVANAIALIKKSELNTQTCSPQLDAEPWQLKDADGYGPGASQTDTAPFASVGQLPLPDRYRHASDVELAEMIRVGRQQLGDRLVILGHFYQRDEVVDHADFIGDSFQLARAARDRRDAEFLVFCGVHFMAETADILSGPKQQVILPNLAAGCSMADMADLASVQRCWNDLSKLLGPEPAVPVTYMNSSAALKAFCGDNGGIVCTSSNAQAVMEWALARNKRVLFFPDQHLGRNTARAMGIGLDVMPMWDPRKALGGNSEAELHNASVILWRGWCSVHKRFTVEQIDKARAEYPGVRVIVHPECPMEVVDAADEFGSTDYIRKAIAACTEPQAFAIGTEINMVRRLAREFPQHKIWCLDPVICPCSTMYRIHPGYLAWIIEGLVGGQVHNQISVEPSTAASARLALERMLEVAK